MFIFLLLNLQNLNWWGNPKKLISLDGVKILFFWKSLWSAGNANGREIMVLKCLFNLILQFS